MWTEVLLLLSQEEIDFKRFSPPEEEETLAEERWYFLCLKKSTIRKSSE
jgi:hypothetical protein